MTQKKLKLVSPFPSHRLTPISGPIPSGMMPLPDELRQLILAAVDEADEQGITVHTIKRRAAGTWRWGRLVEMAVSHLVARGELLVEKRAATGGKRGRPRLVLTKPQGEADG